jgi:hypothetical protein
MAQSPRSPHEEPSRGPAEAPQVAEALRIYRRYQVEFVEALNLCPWAERARLDGHVAERVLLQSRDLVADSLRVIDELTALQEVEIGLIIFAGYRCARPTFERQVAAFIDADRERTRLKSPAFACAAFHPDATAVTSHAERLVPFLRRSPDPTIQLVRVTALERVRKGFSEGTHFFDPMQLNLKQPPPKRELPLRERIAKANLQTIEQVGLARAEAILTAIFEDRDASYQRVGLLPHSWDRTLQP